MSNTVRIFWFITILVFVKANHYRFERGLLINKENDFSLRWNVEGQYAVFEVSARTTGWVGIGVTRSRNMIGADIAFGWVKDGNAHLLDMHGEKFNGRPSVDRRQNLQLVQGVENETHTTIILRRLLKSCGDLKDDISITDSTTAIIWAFGDEDPTGDVPRDINYHGENRGMVNIKLYSDNFKKMQTMPLEYAHFNVSLGKVQIDSATSTHKCRVTQAPSVKGQQHIVKFSPLIGESTRNFLQQFVLKRCNFPIGSVMFKDAVDCSKIKASWKCATLYTWYPGNKDFILPENVGFPFYTEDVSQPVYFLIEVHYQNPAPLKTIVDLENTGVQIFYTSKLRDHNAGILVSGHWVSNLQVILPREKSWLSQGHCVDECLNYLFEKGEDRQVMVIGAHVNGRGVPTQTIIRHIRNGVESRPLFRDYNYDPQYQEMQIFSKLKILERGDSLITECYYETTTRHNVTFGGGKALEETCISSILYYPASSLTLCQSSPSPRGIVRALGVNFDVGDVKSGSNQIDWGSKYGKLAFKNLTHFSKRGSDKDKRKINRKIRKGPQINRCSVDGKMQKSIHRVPRVNKKYHSPNEC